jgi:GNAT superfamily N-acetyltransferase
METLRVAFEPFIDDDIRRFIEEGIDNHNLAVTGMPEWFPANFVLRSNSDEVLGGLLALIWGGWLRVGTLWVSEVARRQGYGSRLLETAETYARERGCFGVCLDTFSFQARPFYERHGYAVFATQDDNPKGHARHFLEKRFTPSGPPSVLI